MINEKLRASIRAKYKTDAAFGLDIGWVPQRVHKLVHNEYIPKIGEAVVISRALDISLDELASFF